MYVCKSNETVLTLEHNAPFISALCPPCIRIHYYIFLLCTQHYFVQVGVSLRLRTVKFSRRQQPEHAVDGSRNVARFFQQRSKHQLQYLKVSTIPQTQHRWKERSTGTGYSFYLGYHATTLQDDGINNRRRCPPLEPVQECENLKMDEQECENLNGCIRNLVGQRVRIYGTGPRCCVVLQ